MTLRVRIDPLDKLFSSFVRLRSKGYCQRCGQYKGISNLQCCHFYSRRYQSVRYDEANCVGLDFGCHQYLDSHPIEKIEFFKQHLGEQAFDMLQARMRQTYPKPDKKLIELYLKEQLRELENG